MSLPWSKFFWSDYASDPALKLCSLGAQGLWMRMLCIAAEHTPPGYVAVNNEPLDAKGIASLAGAPLDQVEGLLAELRRRGVFSVDRRGCIYSRRQVSDSRKRDNARKNGKLGGNPNLQKQKVNPVSDNPSDKGRDNPPRKPQKPESRVQNKTSNDVLARIGESQTKIEMPEGWRPAPLGEGKAASIVGSWSEGEALAQLERFVAYHQAQRSRFSSWQAAWRTWVLNSEQFASRWAKPRTGTSGPRDYLDVVREERLAAVGFAGRNARDD